ncbi:putative universal stress protein [Thermochaetoides thermophila DSM 1495]|uniref:Putative universal stress protein n=1 Tax=Chaetomium thermophilum (strain DSM 1495 / CBS 144.50 / IMI 039719) TaxID=759272 RepID=G0S6U6_CHATD|nr:putative universal stress protein [Thermochaetoides thermophila DSM 1495]EGS20854.1 putative universal stress protein [Thermochaetoides thermophila DSM 1495]
MAENGNHVARLAPPATSPAESPTHDVSPGTKVSSGSTAVDYFSIKPTANGGQSRTSPDASTITITLSSTLQESQENSSRKSSNDSGLPQNGAKRVSGMSVTFRQPRNPSLPQGNPRKTDNRRLRESSPSPVR